MPDPTRGAPTNSVVACDIGGTKMRSALVTSAGSVSNRFECHTHAERGIDDATERLLELIQQSLSAVSSETVSGISISTAGPIDPVSGQYSHPPNLPDWHDHSMIPTLQQQTGLPVVVIHDAHAAALAEARFGAAMNAKDVVYVTVSTGIGGGMLANGIPINGENGFAGEIGHMIIDPSGPKCNAGCRGCLEVMASGSGVASEARRRVSTGAQTSIPEFAAGDTENISGRHVYQAAHAGDKVALEIVNAAVDALATGLANLLATFDPGALVIGGSVITGDEHIGGLSDYWDDLMDRVRDRSLERYKHEVPIVKSALSGDVGLIGAATFFFDQLQPGES